MKPKLPVPEHVFVPADTTTKSGVRDCARCPFGEDREDVHTMPPAGPAQDEHRRRYGETDG